MRAQRRTVEGREPMDTGSLRVVEGAERPTRRDKRAKFVELAQKRTVNAIRAIRVIAKLGNKAHYEYDEKDVKKIALALTKEVEALRSKMINRGKHESIEFRL
jgi:hypothetical protein